MRCLLGIRTFLVMDPHLKERSLGISINGLFLEAFCTSEPSPHANMFTAECLLEGSPLSLSHTLSLQLCTDKCALVVSYRNPSNQKWESAFSESVTAEVTIYILLLAVK